MSRSPIPIPNVQRKLIYLNSSLLQPLQATTTRALSRIPSCSDNASSSSATLFKLYPSQRRTFSHSSSNNVSWFNRNPLAKYLEQATLPSPDKNRVPLSVTEAVKKVEGSEVEKKAVPQQQAPERGDLASSSIFDEEQETTASRSEDSRAIQDHDDTGIYRSWLTNKHLTRRTILEYAGLLPDENKFLRTVKLRHIRRRGRLSKKEILAQEEKSYISKSHLIKTSVKKMAPLARQIAGKDLEYAMVQMRFSPKKVSNPILDHLKLAKAEAVATKGFDVKSTYIDQAWVNRGTPDKGILHQARGRMSRLTLPYTSISVVLKEQKTKERLLEEKAAKLARRAPWVALPNRPIYGQQQYYTW